MDIPWNEHATMIRMAGKSHTGIDEEVEVLFEGPLRDMVKRVKAMTRSERKRLRISMPDRRVRPHSFQDAAIDALIDKLPVAQFGEPHGIMPPSP